MLPAVELVELFDAVAGRASSDGERAAIARLAELVGNDPQKWIAALAAHSLAVAALTRDMDQALRDKLTHADGALASGVSEVIDDHQRRTESATAALEAAGAAARAAIEALREAAAAATHDIGVARSEAVSEAARAILVDLGRAIPAKLTERAAEIAALELARLNRLSQFNTAIWAAIGAVAGIVAPYLWRAV